MSEITFESLQKSIDDLAKEVKSFDSRIVDLEVATKQLNANDMQFENAYNHLRLAMEQFSRQANSNEITVEAIVCWMAGYKPGDYQKDLTMQALDPSAPKNEPQLRPRNDFDSKGFFELLREIGKLANERREKQIREYMAEVEQKAKQKGGIILPNGQKLEIQDEVPAADEGKVPEAEPAKPHLTLVK
jgi:hypothetical protein